MGTMVFISGQEIFLIMIVALLLFGADKLPEVARGIGKGLRDFKKATDDIRNEIESSTTDIRKDMNDIKDSIQKDAANITENIKKNIDDTTGPIKKDLQDTANAIKKEGNEIRDTAYPDD